MRLADILIGTWTLHVVTSIVALNTSWEGGDLALRRNGIGTPIDLRPEQSDGGTSLQGVAFFTDTVYDGDDFLFV